MKKLLLADGLLWVLLGIGMCLGSIQLKLGTFHTPGAGFLPFFAGASLALFGLILVCSTLISQAKEGEAARDLGRLTKRRWKRFLNPSLTVAILVGYILLLEPLGFLLTTFVCLLLLFKLAEPKKWLTPLLLSGSTAILSYLLFSVWLQCQLPKGLLKFW
ncbi:MAG TPA: tripartite tricarboxylate transporter TctB family protein [Syntrophorhabdales bacterium]|nr:tripartite tricarboxylate transporter TctB family protein [Syntrophorhabdales bacterium]